MTQRQEEIIKLISEGYNTKEIAAKMFVSVNTVKTHRKEMMKEYKARNSAHLVALCMREEFDELIKKAFDIDGTNNRS